MALAVVASPRFADHLTPPGHPERVERHVVMQVVAGEFRERGGTVLEPRAATNDELARIHDADYIGLIRETAGRATALDPDTFKYLFVNDAAARLHGISREEVMAKGMFGLWPGDFTKEDRRRRYLRVKGWPDL